MKPPVAAKVVLLAKASVVKVVGASAALTLMVPLLASPICKVVAVIVPSSVVERPSRLVVSVAPRSMFLPGVRCLTVKRPLPLVLKVLVPVLPARFMVSPMKVTLPATVLTVAEVDEAGATLMSAIDVV